MLKWCSYCQQFMQEIAPYDDFSITHGLCARCEQAHPDIFAENEIERAQFLRGIFHALFDAGRRSDFEAAAGIVGRAIDANCRPVDIVIGMIAPMLYEIGEEWKRGALSVEAEHRFTAFSEQVLDLVQSRIDADAMALAPATAPQLFLMNAPGNEHGLAVRILRFWVESRNATARILDHDIGIDALMQEVASGRPDYLLVSMALPEQRDSVAEIARAVAMLPHADRPQVIVGGYPVKAGLIEAIPGAVLLPDIGLLQLR